MRIIALVSILFLALSCKKGKAELTIKGQVNDTTFGTTLNNSTISIYSISPGGSAVDLMFTVNSPDGSYGFTFDREKVEGYLITISKSNYFSVESTISLDELTIESDNVRNFSTTAKAWAAIRLINDAPLPSDMISIIKQQGKENCSECCTNSQWDFYGPLDTTIYCINDGNAPYSYNYFVTGGSNGTILENTVAFDTTELLLHY